MIRVLVQLFLLYLVMEYFFPFTIENRLCEIIRSGVFHFAIRILQNLEKIVLEKEVKSFVFCFASIACFWIGCFMPPRVKGQPDEWINLRYLQVYASSQFLSMTRRCAPNSHAYLWTMVSLLCVWMYCLTLILVWEDKSDRLHSGITLGSALTVMVLDPVAQYLKV